MIPKRMVGSTPDLGSLCLESRGMPLTARPQKTPRRGSGRDFISLRSCSITSNCNMTLRQIENHLREKILKNVKNLIRAFKLFDYNKDECIQCYELRKVLECYCLRMTDSQFERLCFRYHLSRTGAVNYMHFLEKLGINVESLNKRSTEGVAQALNWEDGVQEHEKWMHVQRPVTEEPPINLKSLSMDEIDLAFQKKLQVNYHNLLQAFSNCDVTKSGFISLEELQSVFNNFLFPMSKEIFDLIMVRYKIETNGKIAWKQFLLNSPELGPREEKWASPKQPGVHSSLQDENVAVIQDTPSSPPNGSEKSEAKFERSLSSCHSLNLVGGQFENKKNMDLLQKLHKYFQERYPMAEESRNGIITRQELRRILQCFPFRLTNEEIKAFMLLLDPGHSGYFSCHHIRELIESKKNQNCLNGTKIVKKNIPVAAGWKTVEDILRDKIRHNWDEMRKSFMKNDPENTGMISLGELRKILETHCLTISDQHFEKLCNLQNSSIQVSYQQFLKNLGVSDLPEIITAGVPALNQQQEQMRSVKKENEGSVLGKMMSLNEVKLELWQRIIYCDSTIRKSFFAHKNQCSGKINKEGFKKVLQDCDINMDEHQFNTLVNVLGLKNQDLDFHDFSAHFKDYRYAIKQYSDQEAGFKMRRMIANDCFNHINENLKRSSLGLRSLFDQLDRNHDGLITMYDFRTMLDPLSVTTMEYHRFLETLGLLPESKLNYLEFIKIIKMIESKQGQSWMKSANNSIDDTDNPYLFCEQAHGYLANKAKTRWNELNKTFNQIDSEGNLIAEKKDIRELLCCSFLPFSPKQFETLWSWYDPDNKGFVSYFEFLQKLRSRFGSQVQTDRKQIVPVMNNNLMNEFNKPHQDYADHTQQKKFQTGQFDIHEFRTQLKVKFRDHHKGFNETFFKLDKCNDGCITISDFQRVLKDHHYQLGQEQLKQLFVRLEIPLYNNKFSYSHFLRAIEDNEDTASKCGSKFAFIPRENLEDPCPEKVITKLKEVVIKSYGALFKAFKAFDKYGNGKISSLAFHQVLNNVCFRMTDREFNYLLGKLKLDSEYMVDWLDFLQTYTIYNYKAAEVPYEENHTTRPKSSLHLTMDDIMSNIREVVNKCLYTTTHEFEALDYANIQVISKKNFKEVFFKHFMSLTDEQFENLWNNLPVNDYGNLEYHKFLKQFTEAGSLEVKSGRTSPTKLSRVGSTRSSSVQSRKTPSSFQGNEQLLELSQQPGPVASLNTEAIERKLKKDVKRFCKEIQKECKEKDTAEQGEINAADFQAIMKKFCIPIKPEEFQELAKKYETKNTGHFAYREFLQRLVLSLGQLDMNPLQRMRIPHPKIPMSPGTEHKTFTHLMMRIQPCITKCWKLMRRTFKAYDETGSGYLSLFLFRQILQQYGISLSEEEFYYLSSYYDKHLQGTISYNEFLRVFL
ncbi:EF-hand calcium-binding domain-containing protein 6 isoform X2 [Narcine bancroftii]|uniref:EF-hand calcium-binding domain-containing protein 6 isoform X2 n=1 Tax=Narcine bancroftii TaxID=1343680 RepID=UPI0038313B25